MKSKLLITLTAVLLPIAFGPRVISAEQLILIVATNDAPSPDGIGTIFSFTPATAPRGPSLNDAGQAAFRASLMGTGVGPTNNSGIFRASPGNLTLLVRSGQLAPDGTNRFDSLITPFGDVPALNNAGQVAFAAALTGPGVGSTNETGLFRAQTATGIVTQIARKGQLAPDGNGGFDGRFDDFSTSLAYYGSAFNNSGQVAFGDALTGTANDRGIFRGDGTTLTQIARKNQIGPGGRFSGFIGPALNNAGQVAFIGYTDTIGGSGYYRSDGTTLTIMAYEGQPLPDGNGNIVESYFSPVSLNDAGQIAFRALINGGGQGVLRADGATLTIIARTGQPTPDGMATFASLKPGAASADYGVVLNNAGQVAFWASLTGAGVGSTNDQGVFRGDGTSANLRQVARKGQPAPDSNANFDTFYDNPIVAINDSGQVAFLAYLSDSGNSHGIYLYDDHLGLRKVVRSGDPFLGSTVEAVHLSTSPTLGDEVDGLNNCGQVTFWFGLDNGTAGMAIWHSGEIRITSIEKLGADIRLTWNTLRCFTNFVQASPALTLSANNNFTNISGPIYVPAAIQQTNYVEIGGATNRPNRFYRICVGL